MAVVFLKNEGYSILERNYRCRYGEIDIIAMDKGSIVFVEVKQRGSDLFGSPEDAIGRIKQKKISRVALNYLQEKSMPDHNSRFDVVGIYLAPRTNRIELIRNAFELSI